MKRTILATILLIVLALAGHAMEEYCKIPHPDRALPDKSEMVHVELELVYQGKKDGKVGSVQSMAITEKHFVIAGRPRGSAAMGGETNNRIYIIDREKLTDVTAQYKKATKTYELGHANGITYNPKTGELLVVGVRDDNGAYMRTVCLSARNFATLKTETLPTAASGIAYDAEEDHYYVRSGARVSVLDGALQTELLSHQVDCGLASQDIGFYDDSVYLTNWVNTNNYPRAHEAGLELNENTIVRINKKDGRIERVYVIDEPHDELEGIVFDEKGTAYVLMNGQGSSKNKFFIYRANLR